MFCRCDLTPRDLSLGLSEQRNKVREITKTKINKKENL